MIEYIPNENEIVYEVDLCDNERIKDLAIELEKKGFGEYAKRFYATRAGGTPYFVIPKPYEKEQETDPDTMNMWIDVTHEYTVTAQHYYHTHFDSAEMAAQTVRDFYDGALAEYLVITPNYTIAFVSEAKKSWEEAIKVFAKYNKLAGETFQQMAPAIPAQSHHSHTYKYGVGLPLNDIIVAKEKNAPLCEREIYQISVIFGKHPEYYFDY